MQLRLCFRAYHQENSRCFTSAIPCNVFGPNDNFRPAESHVIPGMIQRLHKLIYLDEPEKSQEEKEFVVFGSGKPLRQFIYSLDLARLLIWTLRNYESVEPIILSVDEADEVSIGQVAKSIAKAFGFRGKIKLDTPKCDGQFKKTASNKKLREFLHHFKFIAFDQAIKENVDWFLNNFEVARK